MIARVLAGLVGVALLGLGAFFAFAFYVRYWQWRDCFNELGRCYDPVSQDVYLEQSGAVWGGMAGISLALAALVLFRVFRR
jgi:hypothetical protein